MALQARHFDHDGQRCGGCAQLQPGSHGFCSARAILGLQILFSLSLILTCMLCCVHVSIPNSSQRSSCYSHLLVPFHYSACFCPRCSAPESSTRRKGHQTPGWCGAARTTQELPEPRPQWRVCARCNAPQLPRPVTYLLEYWLRWVPHVRCAPVDFSRRRRRRIPPATATASIGSASCRPRCVRGRLQRRPAVLTLQGRMPWRTPATSSCWWSCDQQVPRDWHMLHRAAAVTRWTSAWPSSAGCQTGATLQVVRFSGFVLDVPSPRSTCPVQKRLSALDRRLP